LREAANITDANNIDCEISEEVNDVVRALAQPENEYKRRGYRTQELFDEVDLE
jgi:hypothetical protein